jgi:cobalt/nickel transport system permease protein
MHIPDGLIYAQTAVATGATGAGLVAVALRKARKTLEDRQIPLVGVTAAFIFAAQMVTFPVAGGTSAHLLGGAMAGILLGPWLGALVETVVYTVQAIGFADGGITALVANVLMMGFLPAVGGYYLFRAGMRRLPRTRTAFLGMTAVTSWVTIVLAAALGAFFIATGGPLPTEAYPIMIGIHALVGIGEAVIATAVIAAVMSVRPDLMATRDLLPGRDAGSLRRARS